MSVGPFLLGATIALVLVPWCSGGLCLHGLGSKTCLRDLSGYSQCVNDEKNPSSVKYITTKCSSGTRCSCMGSPCPKAGNPCSEYELPPEMPDSYHYEFNEQFKRCEGKTECQKTYNRLAVWRDSENRKYREDRTMGGGHDPPYEYYIIRPFRSRWLLKAHIIPSKQSCTLRLTTRFPAKIAVPSKYTFHGRKYVYGDYVKRWLWLQGTPPSFEIWDTAQTVDGTPRIVQYTGFFPQDAQSGKSIKIERYFYTFNPGTPSRNVFELPTYCRRRPVSG